MKPSCSNKLIFSVMLSLVLGHFAPTMSYASVKPAGASSHKFKLHAWRTEFPDQIEITDDWKHAPAANSAVVNQINAVRTKLPNWSGVHQIIPGGHLE